MATEKRFATGMGDYITKTGNGAGVPGDPWVETFNPEVAAGGGGKCVKVALTVTAALYTAGNSIGGKITIADAVRISGGVSILAGIHLLDRANQKPVGTIYIFDADPSAATLTDKTAFVFSTDDLKVVATIPVAAADWITTNSKATAHLRSLAAEVQAASGTTLYAAFVTTSAPTFAATTDMQAVFDLVYVN